MTMTSWNTENSARFRDLATSEQVLIGAPTDEQITGQLIDPVLHPPAWLLRSMLITGLASSILFVLIAYTLVTGVGVWGNNIPNAWAFAITNFVWWIGIGHAGTFISAFLLLLEQPWRTSINRFAEGMTLFAIVQAGLFPLLHMGRAWFFYWLTPYPSTMGVWPQFRSSLTWDVAAVTTYFTVSLLFWYLGLIPDLAILRDRAPTLGRRRVYGIFALGWYGSSTQWSRYRIAYGLLAGLATPLVISVHSIVSMDFAIAIIPGWHSAIFPPYFVAGAIFSGFAMVLTLMIPARALYRLESFITKKHLDNMAKMLLVTSLIVTYAYLVEVFTAWLSGDKFERFIYLSARPSGPYAAGYWTVLFCNCVVPQTLWFRRCRTTPAILWTITIFIQVGMWLERFMLIVSSTTNDRLPASWEIYKPSLVDVGILLGTICFFLFLFSCFLRWVPFIPVSEMKELARKTRHDLLRKQAES
jgi:Ni/Fe-hydrogenase subunit HybB-like protein